VILRNVLENPGWYTAYTPYQAEIAQGRLEALVNFQTLICELTGMEIANASLLDEATAAAEAMAMAHALSKNKSNTIAVADDVHPQTRGVLTTRATALGLKLAASARARRSPCCCNIPERRAKCAILPPISPRRRRPGRWPSWRPTLGVDVAEAARGNGRRRRCRIVATFRRAHGIRRSSRGILRHTRRVQTAHAGRLVGVSVDAAGAPAMRLALQTREQHIRREKATSNICTSQVLLAVIAGCMPFGTAPRV